MDPHFLDETGSTLSNSIGNTSTDSWLPSHQPYYSTSLRDTPVVFKDELGTLKGFTAKHNDEKDVKPTFCKACPVHLALQDKVDAELAKLEKLGIIESVQYSNWAAPVVPVGKADKSI